MSAYAVPSLEPDHPHSPQRTAELAGALVKIVSVLNDATKDGEAPAPGLGWPVSPEDVFDRLARLAEGTSTLYPQLADALCSHDERGAWRAAPVDSTPRDLRADLELAADHLKHASDLAADIATCLFQARNLLGAVRPNHPASRQCRPEI